MGAGDDFGFYAYTSDDLATYSVKLSEVVATAGGFTPMPAADIKKGYPFGPRNMRHVWGVTSGGQRAKLPIAQADNTKFTAGGTFSLRGASFTIQGAIGEQRKLSFLGG